MYKKPNEKVSSMYKQIYDKAKSSNVIKHCYVGDEREYRLTSRDSYFAELTDPDVMLKYVLYPLYVDGN